MPISDKTRKILWGRSGNRCAICKHELVIDATATDDESVIGDECHIISRQLNGPRHEPNYPKDQFDSYENLILLCRIHHKIIDDQHEAYTASILDQMKSNHEVWVSQKLSDNPQPKPMRLRRVKENIPDALVRLHSGRDVLNVVSHAYLGSYDHEELRSEEEVDAVAQFFQEVRDWGDMDAEPSDQVRLAYKWTHSLAELERFGLLVFGGREVQIFDDGFGGSHKWPVSILHVARQDSEAIIRIDAASEPSCKESQAATGENKHEQQSK